MSRVFIFYLFSITFRSLVLAALVGASLTLTRKVQLRHAVWTVVLCFLFLMPIADALLPATGIPSSLPEAVRPIQGLVVYSPVSRLPPVVTFETTRTTTQLADRWRLMAILVVTISLGFSIRLTLIFRQVARLKRMSPVIPHTHWDHVRNISVRESHSITIPLTVGVWHPVLILPATWRDWDHWKLGAVLTHERTHIERRDWAVAVIASIAKCIYWFNPLVWWLERKLSSLAEQASDEACVRACGDAPRYAETLLEFASAANQKHRLVGGIAMAQYKISQRIQRILALRHPGSGVLPRPAWVLLLVLSLPGLYVSAASQLEEKMPALAPAELRQFLQPLIAPLPVGTLTPAPLQATSTETRQSPIGNPPQQTSPTAPSPAIPPAPSQQATNPDLVGEIRLILAPVDQAIGQAGQVEVQTRTGTNRYTGTAVWNIRNNNAPSAWNLNTLWNVNNATFAFALTGVQGRKALFEDQNGNTFSYGCPSCAFFVSQSGVGALPANPDLGISFQLSADGKSMSATCHARECRLASIISNGTIAGGLGLLLVNSQTTNIGVAQSPPAACFNIFGNNKADGSPFTDADCVVGAATEMVFAVTR